MKPRIQRKSRTTVLLVGEGSSEEEFLRHLKALYVTRESNIAITVKNARGKGAAHVIGVAQRYSHGAEFDLKVALLDTDQDWNKATERAAKACRVTVLASEPCFEATLLSINQHRAEGLSSEQLKREFTARYGAAASNPSVYAVHFRKEVLDTAAQSIEFLRILLKAIHNGSADK